MSNLSLKWKRPESNDYPKVLHTFKARDVDADELVEYRIQDLPESRFEDALQVMRDNFIRGEPVSEVLGASDDPDYYEDYKLGWVPVMNQKMSLVCFKTGSDEIVGVNLTYVASKGEDLLAKAFKQFKSPKTIASFEIFFMLYDNYDPFEHYGVDKYMASLGLTVNPKYRGRAIGDHFLATRKLLMKEFELKFTQTIFSSNFSNRNADKAGYVLDVEIRYKDIFNLYPQIADIKSDVFTLKSLHCNSQSDSSKNQV